MRLFLYKSFRVLLVSCLQHLLTLLEDSLAPAIMHIRWRQEDQSAVLVLVVIPLEISAQFS